MASFDNVSRRMTLLVSICAVLALEPTSAASSCGAQNGIAEPHCQAIPAAHGATAMLQVLSEKTRVQHIHIPAKVALVEQKEFGALDVRNMMKRAVKLTKEYAAHRSFLRRAVDKMKKAMPDETVEKLVNEMSDSQATEEDKLSGHNADAQHKLQQLQVNILDAVAKINATEIQIQAATATLAAVESQVEKNDQRHAVALAECVAKKKEDKELLSTMKKEAEQLRILAAPATVQQARPTNRNTVSDEVRRDTAADTEEETPEHLRNLPTIPSFFQKLAREAPKKDSRVEALALLKKSQNLQQSLSKCLAPNGDGPASTASLLLIGINGQLALKRTAGRHCAVGANTRATLGGTLKTVSLGRRLEDGGQSSTMCSSINEDYSGTVWLDCKDGTVEADMSHCTLGMTTAENYGSAECEKIKETVETLYPEVVEDTSHIMSDLESQVASTACEDTADELHSTGSKPLSEEMSKSSEKLSELITTIQTSRPIVESMLETEAELESEITSMDSQEEVMPEMQETLEQVKDAIHALELCPGITNPDFKIPVWVGTWDVKHHFTATVAGNGQTDDDIDAEMDKQCATIHIAGQAGTPRAAEIAEIEEGSIDGLPAKNGATVPLWGKCPGCEGGNDANGSPLHVSGHARVCWDTGADLTVAGCRTNCANGEKTIICVVDQHSAPFTTN